MTHSLSRAHILISGLVQGVGYRYFVYKNASKQAPEMRLSGFVRNLLNGDVEVDAQGNRESIEQLIAKLRVGPPGAVVEDVKVEWVEPRKTSNQFEIE